MTKFEWLGLQAEANLLLGAWAIENERKRRTLSYYRRRGTTTAERRARLAHARNARKLGEDVEGS
jgi:hypothetical protein